MALRTGWKTTAAAGLIQVVVTGGLVVIALRVWGADPLRDAIQSVTLWSIAAGLVLGALGIICQAYRWRIIAARQSIHVSPGSAILRCWQAAFLNGVLPGGVAGDALRAADDSTDAQAHRPRRALARGFGAVLSERLVGTCLVFAAASFALLLVLPWAGLICLGLSAAAGGVAWWWLRQLTASEILRVLGLSLLGWTCFAVLFLIAAATVAAPVPLHRAPALAAIALAGMSVPVSVGGWGAREAAASWGGQLYGLEAVDGVAVSVIYGVLALISTLPGAAIFSARLIPRIRHARSIRGIRRSPEVTRMAFPHDPHSK